MIQHLTRIMTSKKSVRSKHTLKIISFLNLHLLSHSLSLTNVRLWDGRSGRPRVFSSEMGLAIFNYRSVDVLTELQIFKSQYLSGSRRMLRRSECNVIVLFSLWKVVFGFSFSSFSLVMCLFWLDHSSSVISECLMQELLICLHSMCISARIDEGNWAVAPYKCVVHTYYCLYPLLF